MGHNYGMVQRNLDNETSPVRNSDCNSVDLSSITNSNGVRSTLPSIFGIESLNPDSAGNDNDITSLNFDHPISIVGRSKEMISLQDAFYSLQPSQDQSQNSSWKKRTIALVHGVSGSGKTSLVEQSLRQITSDTQGFFVTGKYESISDIREPHAALLEAFSDLCDLTIQSTDFPQRQSEIQQRMGRQSAQILANAVSNLMTIWRSNEESDFAFHQDEDYTSTLLPEARYSNAFATFMVACKSFLMAMSSKEHPIVLFIDDIQWMDDGSRQILSFFLNDKALTNIMFVLAYRHEEQDFIHDFLQETRSLSDVLDIELQNLEANDVCSLIVNMIGSTTSSIQELGKIIASKSGGNPFHVTQFLKCIQKDKLMTFNSKTSMWEFEVDEIHRNVMVSEKLADLLTLRITKLAESVQYCLKIASLLGYCFSEELLNQVVSSLQDSRIQNALSSSMDSVSASLSEAMELGFIEKTKDGYQFGHDKLQFYFVSMIDDSERSQIHLKIGLVYLKREGAESNYLAALHLHQAPCYASTESTRVQLAEVNLKAAKYCNKLGAFMDASVFLIRGLECIDPGNKWTQHFDLSYELTQMLSRVELIIGHHDSSKERARELLEKARTTKMKIDALLIEVECCMACNQMEETIKAANRALRVLGIYMPGKTTMRHVIAKLIKVKLMIGRKSNECILSLPMMKDKSMEIAVRLLLHLYLYCFLKNEDSQALYSALLAMEITLKNGLNAYAASALTIYGIAELASGDYRRGYRFGKLAISLLDKFENREAECSTIVLALTTLTHWYDPLRDMPPILYKASNKGLESGDVVYGSLCLSICYAIRLIIGENLEQVETFMKSSNERIQDLSQDSMIMWVQPALQYVANLRAQDVVCWKDLTNLTGDIMKESTFIEEAMQANHQTLIMSAWMHKALLCCLFGDWAKAESVFQDMMRLSDGFYFGFGVIPCSLFGGLASFSLFKENRKRKHLRFAKKNQNTLRQAQMRGCPNAPVFLNLLIAEALSVKKSAKPQLVTAAYDFAIEAMASEKYPQFEALANERAGFYQIQCKNRIAADNYFKQALNLYKYEWGSFAKHDWLTEKVERAMSMLPIEITINDLFGTEIGISRNI
jgi:predicted ATPase